MQSICPAWCFPLLDMYCNQQACCSCPIVISHETLRQDIQGWKRRRSVKEGMRRGTGARLALVEEEEALQAAAPAERGRRQAAALARQCGHLLPHALPLRAHMSASTT